MHNTAELSDIALADAIEAECPGRTEWQIMNADETALCMWFTHDDYTRPAHAAQKWLDEHPSKKAEGYHVVERHLHSKREELALEAATRLRAARPRLSDAQVDKLAKVGPVYAPDGVVSRLPEQYRRELKAQFRRGLRAGEAAHGITGAPDGHQQT